MSDTKTEILFNEKTFDAFEKEKLDIPHATLAEKERCDKFRSKFKEEQTLLQIIVNTMNRWLF